MDIKDLYEYAWTHSQVPLDTEDHEYLLCFFLDKIQHKSTETIGLLQRAIDRKKLVFILNQLTFKIYLDARANGKPYTTDWLEENLLEETPDSYRHLQTELDRLIQEPERTYPEFYHIPAWLCHPTVFGNPLGLLSDFPELPQTWCIRCVRRTSYLPSDTDADETTSEVQE